MANGNTNLNLESKAIFEDDKYLQPVLEDDAVLFSLDELIGPDVCAQPGTGQANDANGSIDSGSNDAKMQELQVKMRFLQRQFADYRLAVEQTLEQKWSQPPSDGDAATAGPSDPVGRNNNAASARAEASSLDDTSRAAMKEKNDTTYFDSYSYNGWSSPASGESLTNLPHRYP